MPHTRSLSGRVECFSTVCDFRSDTFLPIRYVFRSSIPKNGRISFLKKKKKKILVRLCLLTFGLTVMVQINLLQLKNHVLPSLKKCFFKCWISPKWSLHVCVYILLYCAYIQCTSTLCMWTIGCKLCTVNKSHPSWLLYGNTLKSLRTETQHNPAESCTGSAWVMYCWVEDHPKLATFWVALTLGFPSGLQQHCALYTTTRNS